MYYFNDGEVVIDSNPAISNVKELSNMIVKPHVENDKCHIFINILGNKEGFHRFKYSIEHMKGSSTVGGGAIFSYRKFREFVNARLDLPPVTDIRNVPLTIKLSPRGNALGQLVIFNHTVNVSTKTNKQLIMSKAPKLISAFHGDNLKVRWSPLSQGSRNCTSLGTYFEHSGHDCESYQAAVLRTITDQINSVCRLIAMNNPNTEIGRSLRKHLTKILSEWRYLLGLAISELLTNKGVQWN